MPEEENIKTITFNELLDYLRANNLKLAPSTLKVLKTLGYIPRTSEYNISKVMPIEKVSKFWMTGTGIPEDYLPCFAFDARITNYCLKFIMLRNLPIFIKFIQDYQNTISTERMLHILKYANELDTNFKLYSSEDESKKSLVVRTFLEYCSNKRIPAYNISVNVLKIMINQPTLKDMETVYEALAHPILRNNPECVENAKSKRNVEANRKYLKNKTEILEKAIVANDREINPRINNVCFHTHILSFLEVDGKGYNAGEFLKNSLDTINYYEDYELLRELLDGSNILTSVPVLAIIRNCQNADEYGSLRDICYSLIYYLKNKDNLEKRPYLKSIRHSIISKLAASKDENITYLLNELMMVVDTETKEISKPRLLRKK